MAEEAVETGTVRSGSKRVVVNDKIPVLYEELLRMLREGHGLVTDEVIRLFAEMSGDFNGVHLRKSDAQMAGFADRIAHGALGFMLIADHWRESTIVEFNVEFRKPVFLKDIIAIEENVGDPLHGFRLLNDKGLIVTKGTATIEEGRCDDQFVPWPVLMGLISSVLGMEYPGPGTIYMGQSGEFISPVRPGEEVIVIAKLIGTMGKASRATGKIETEVRRANSNELVVSGVATVMMPPPKAPLQ